MRKIDSLASKRKKRDRYGSKAIIFVLTICVMLLLADKIFNVPPSKSDGVPAKHTEKKHKEKTDGRWYRLRTSTNASEKRAINETQLKKLSTLAYLKGYSKPTSKTDGVVLYEQERAYDGYTLFCSGHKSEVYLMDMQGNMVHRWRVNFENIWLDPLPFEVDDEHRQFIRRAYLYPNGDLLCLFEYVGLIKIDKHSNLIWEIARRNHHDIHVAENGHIYTLITKNRDLSLSNKHFFKKIILDDQVMILDSEGRKKDTISLFDAFYHSTHAGHMFHVSRKPDIFHTNSVQTASAKVAARLDFVNPGDILVSLRNTSTIAIIDAIEHTVKWAMTGMWFKQHQAMFLENGNILLFDNRGGNKYHFFKFNRSRIVEIDPRSQKIVWQYKGTARKKFYSHWLGYNQRLPNGNTLITESTQGHIFEVTPEHQIVWEYYSAFRTGKDDELVAALMGAQRLNPERLFGLQDDDSHEVLAH